MRITVLPAESGRPVTKSNAMWDHGRDGMGRGLRRPAGGELLDLSQVKSSHLYLYSAFNNTNCNKALHNIKIGKFVNNVK